MTLRAALRDIIEGMEWQSDEMVAYLNIQTGQVVPVSEEDLAAAERGETDPGGADWEIEALEIARGVLTGEDYIALPARLEIDEYRMMERFACDVADTGASADLLAAIKGSGAFRRFRDTVRHLGLGKEWLAYRDRGYESVALAWCEAHGVVVTRAERNRR
jgi:hypothetical protein